MVFKIHSGDIGDIVAKGFDSCANIGGQGGWGEDGECARLEADLGARESVRVLGEEWKEQQVPMVPRPPTLNRPKRLKGAEQVVMLGVTLRITITDAGSGCTSLEVIVNSREAQDVTRTLVKYRLLSLI